MLLLVVAGGGDIGAVAGVVGVVFVGACACACACAGGIAGDVVERTMLLCFCCATCWVVLELLGLDSGGGVV